MVRARSVLLTLSVGIAIVVPAGMSTATTAPAPRADGRPRRGPLRAWTATATGSTTGSTAGSPTTPTDNDSA